MPLTPGTRLGPYEIAAQIGAGGMGEVYRAIDTSLKRQVAIKVLPQSLAGDADRLARFQREAELLASLNHPNIAAIHGLDRSDGHTALVMELVEGPTLADRIAQGAVPLDEAVAIAKQMADALEAAHERGIIHRDLKPANIKVRPDGTVKVLDFGLAKAADPVAAGVAGLATLATITSPAMTQLGMILGTAAYMSPEQARGRAVDKRTDIWAFGCVLFEMLAGVRPFDGEDVTEVIGAVIHKNIDWARLPRTTPAAVRTALERCLEKDPKKRIRDIGDVRLALDGAFTSIEAPSVMRRGRSPVAITAAIVAAATLGAATMWIVRAPSSPDTVAFSVDTGRTATPASLALSPNGRQLVFTSDDKGVQKLWIRALDSTTARVIPGTDQASGPFWAPDSTRIAFFAGNLLKQVDLVGSAPQTIAQTSTTVALGGTWNDRDVILFAKAGGGVFRVPATGGSPQPVTTPSAGRQAIHGWPTFLPDGNHFVYLRLKDESESRVTELVWRALDSSEERVVRSSDSGAWFSSTGHLVFRVGDAIVAQRFDASTGTVSGNTIQLASAAWWTGSRVAFTLSSAGVLAYRPSGTGGAVAQLSWVDRQGKVVGQIGAAGDYYENLVMDGAETHAAANTPVGTEDVWVVDITRGTKSRLTFDRATDSDPVFSPDGSSLAFYSTRNAGGIYRRPTDGSGADELIAQTGLQAWPRDWSPDGRFILYQSGAGDLWLVPLTGDRKPFPYLMSPSRERDGRFSPDGGWVAYSSDETGRDEVFVRDFPAKSAKFQVSTMGGIEPRWRADGRELFYIDPDGTLMSVDVAPKPTFTLGVPTPMFKTQLMNLPIGAQRRYTVSRDGRRLLMNIPLDAAALTPVTVIVNWQSMLDSRR